MRSKQALPQQVLFIMALLLALASGCMGEFEKISIQLRVRPNGSAIMYMDFSFGEAVLTLRAFGISSCKALIEQDSSSIPKERIQVVEDRLSEGRCRISISFKDFEELRTFFSGPEIRRLTLDPANRRFEIEMIIDARTSAAREMEFILDLPGTPLQHNADEVRGRQLIWHLERTQERIWAASTVEPEGIPAGFLVLIGILGGVAALGFLILRRGGLPRLIAPGVPAQRFCSYCGASLLPGARFCSRCGRPI